MSINSRLIVFLLVCFSVLPNLAHASDKSLRSAWQGWRQDSANARGYLKAVGVTKTRWFRQFYKSDAYNVDVDLWPEAIKLRATKQYNAPLNRLSAQLKLGAFRAANLATKLLQTSPSAVPFDRSVSEAVNQYYTFLRDPIRQSWHINTLWDPSPVKGGSHQVYRIVTGGDLWTP